MSRYFFDLEDSVPMPDDEGTELPDDAKAKAQAIVFAGEYLSSNPDILDATHRFAVKVSNGGREPIFVVEIRTQEPGG